MTAGALGDRGTGPSVPARGQTALVTLPDLMHWVQTLMYRTVPFRTAFTRWMLGRQTFDVLLLAWETLCPKPGPLPQSVHLAIGTSVI
jgi:hypothetical protein